MLFALLAAALAPSPMIVVSSDAAPIACPVVETSVTAGAAACGEKHKGPPVLVVEGGPGHARSIAAQRAPAPVDAARPVHLETLALYGPEGERPVRVSLETTPERANQDIVALREIASKIEAYPVWRARAYDSGEY